MTGGFDNIADLQAIEHFVRTVILHDELVMEAVPLSYDPILDEEYEWTESERDAGFRNVLVAFGPVLTGFDFFTDNIGPRLPAPNINLSPALLQVARRFANAGEGNAYFQAHVEFLQRVLGAVEQGGSALLTSQLGLAAISRAQAYPEELFRHLDDTWISYAEQIREDGLSLVIPPILGIVLTRCARREAIPTVIRDLRAELAEPRNQIWRRLDALRKARTLGEANEIRRELSQASRIFPPSQSELSSRPLRVLWEIVAGAAAGLGIAQLSGSDPTIGAATGAITQTARAAPGFLHEFGQALFGRGAFDLGRRVSREASRIELDCLTRLLSEEERQKSGLP